MKTSCKTLLATAGLVLAVSGISALSLPTHAAGFSVLGGSLGLTQRDFRVWNNFTDTQANNNTTPHANFPSQTGAVMAIWKGHVEWGSEPYGGNGLGDGLPASNPILGDGGANFDNTFQGLATSQPGQSNVHAELNGDGGSVLAFTQGLSSGWTIKYYSSWVWQDGPGNVTTGIDLQGVACHEIGHSLGLGHSTAAGATMLPNISGTGVPQRSLEPDDINGIKAIYGVKSASKPHIGSLGATKEIGQTLTINGSNFSGTNNEVWFTKAQPSDGNPVKVTGVASTSGGTVINVTIPSGIQDGDVLVKNNAGSGGSNLSNAFPMDIGAQTGNPPVVSNASPSSGPEGGYTPVTITGTGFNGTLSVKFGLNDAISFIVDSDTQISAVAPPGALFTAVDITVADGEGSDALTSFYLYVFNPAPSISNVSPAAGPFSGGTEVTVTGASVVGVTDVQFDGISGTSLEIVSETELTVVAPAHAIGFVDVTAFGDGSSTLPGAYHYVNQGSFTDIGPGIGSIFGIPVLVGSGDLTPGSVAGFNLTTNTGPPDAPAAMFFSLVQASVPFKGGTLYTLPILIQLNVALNGFSTFNLHTSIPLSAPSGLNLYVQTWIKDIFGPAGVTATNGLQVTVP